VKQVGFSETCVPEHAPRLSISGTQFELQLSSPTRSSGSHQPDIHDGLNGLWLIRFS